MNKEQYNSKKAWKNAREQAKNLAIKKSIAKCYEMLEMVPDAPHEPDFHCEHKNFVESPRWMHTLECADCGYMTEHPKKAEINIYGQHSVQPANSTPVERDARPGTNGEPDGAGETDQSTWEERQHNIDAFFEAGSDQGRSEGDENNTGREGKHATA